jgi:hypothetical protein
MADLYTWSELKSSLLKYPNDEITEMLIQAKKEIDPKGYEKTFGEKKISKKYKEINLIKGRSDLKKNKNGKYSVDTEMNFKEGLEPKVKRALINSIIEELNKNFDCYEFFYQKKN